MHLVGNDAVRHRDVDGVDEVLEQPLPGLHALLDALDLLDLAAQVVAQLVEGVELAGQLREVVVRGRQFPLLDGLDGDGDLGLGAGALATGERRGEGRRLAGLQAGDGLVHALEHLAGADLVGDAADAVDLLVVDRGVDVERDEVARLRGAVDADERAEPLAEVVEALVDVGVRHLDLIDGDLDALEVGELELGPDVDLCGELRARRPWRGRGPLSRRRSAGRAGGPRAPRPLVRRSAAAPR